ncbi:MAG: indole-3-glycerol phosphate synthase TrpC [Gemmatimonadaceae bacterium]
MQVSREQWTPPTGTLGRIVAESHARVAGLLQDRRAVQDLERAAAAAPPAPSFAAALRRRDIALIAEVKRRSPSRGEINAALSARDQAAAYAAGGAAALSVLTEPEHFGGSLDDLRSATGAVSVPALRKDFIVDEVQLLEARANGAAAALLIVRALAPAELEKLIRCARAAGLEPLVEVHRDAELDRALAAGAHVIGVNNRDLETLHIDAATGDRLLPRVPRACIAVSESGMLARGDVERAARAGADAVLIGSVLSASLEPEHALRALIGVPRSARVR